VGSGRGGGGVEVAREGENWRPKRGGAFFPLARGAGWCTRGSSAVGVGGAPWVLRESIDLQKSPVGGGGGGPRSWFLRWIGSKRIDTRKRSRSCHTQHINNATNGWSMCQSPMPNAPMGPSTSRSGGGGFPCRARGLEERTGQSNSDAGPQYRGGRRIGPCRQCGAGEEHLIAVLTLV